MSEHSRSGHTRSERSVVHATFVIERPGPRARRRLPGHRAGRADLVHLHRTPDTGGGAELTGGVELTCVIGLLDLDGQSVSNSQCHGSCGPPPSGSMIAGWCQPNSPALSVIHR